ncbi:MAG: phospholipid carrier-dependent glycosyltransferase [Vicinamibacterales bacterium]
MALTVLAGGMRFAGITQPSDLVFDEHYAADACLFVLGPAGGCPVPQEIGLVHPPLGKWLIGAGIELFGFTPVGWRVAPLAAGTLSVALLYLLARRLLGSTLAASLAAGLLAFDFLHFVMSRTAMLDVFVVLFGLASFLCLVYDCDRDPSGETDGTSLPRLHQRPWLLAAGLAGGAAVASKWSGGYLLAAVALLALAHGVTHRRHGQSGIRHLASRESVPLLVAFVLVPAAVYVGSYAGTLRGSLFAWPWAEGSWTHVFFERHRLMFDHHMGSLYTHPYMSSAWSWPLIKRPVLFYFRELEGGVYQEILAIGNPVIWWAALAALAVTTWQAVRGGAFQAREWVIVAGFAAGYVPWLLITRQEAFLYYFLPSVPFLYLAVGHLVSSVPAGFRRLTASGALVVASVGMFLFFWPLLTGRPVSHQRWEQRMLFSNCDPAERTPVIRPVPPPAGWCWQ